jgi:hypothetical protein
MAVTAFAVGMLAPALAFADTASTSSIQTLLDQLKALQTQMQGLQQQSQQTIATLVTTLQQGSTGDNVKILQSLLAADPSIYPEGTISGFFGKLTSQAVKRFQKKHGIEQAGNVGPKTLKKLNELLGEHPMAWGNATSTANREGNPGQGEDKRPCAIVPPGHLIAPGWLRKHEGDDKPVVPPCQTLPKGIKDQLENENEHGTTPPVVDVTAPVVSNPLVSSIATTTATVSWTTNENATGKVYYSVTAPINLGTALTMSNAALTLSHSFGLIGLTASTTYYYVLESKDAANNTATTSSASFTTTN